MKLSLQTGRCEGYGLCEEAGPRVYRLPLTGDEDVELLFTEVPPELEHDASAGACVCPVAAILISR